MGTGTLSLFTGAKYLFPCPVIIPAFQGNYLHGLKGGYYLIIGLSNPLAAFNLCL